jgi:hypothetical protein
MFKVENWSKSARLSLMFQGEVGIQRKCSYVSRVQSWRENVVIPGVFPRFDSSPIVVNESIGLKPMGDCVSGSGDVPHEEVAPMLEFEDADGELVDSGPVRPKFESALPLDAFATLELVRG